MVINEDEFQQKNSDIMVTARKPVKENVKGKVLLKSRR